MFLKIGPLQFSLELVADAALRTRLAQSLGAFMRPRPQRVDPAVWQIEFSRISSPHRLTGGLDFTIEDQGFQLSYPMYAAHGPWPGPGTVRATVVHQIDSPEHEVDWIIGVLRVLTTEILRRQGYLVFHGAAVQLTNQLGVLAVGPRGQGKTTFANGPWTRSRWSDDHGMVHISDPPSLVGVPFTGRERTATQPGDGGLDLIVIPERGAIGCTPTTSLCTKDDAMEYLIRNLICVDDRSITFQANMSLLSHLIDRVPVVRLSYDRDTDATELLSAIHRACETRKLAS